MKNITSYRRFFFGSDLFAAICFCGVSAGVFAVFLRCFCGCFCSCFCGVFPGVSAGVSAGRLFAAVLGNSTFLSLGCFCDVPVGPLLELGLFLNVFDFGFASPFGRTGRIDGRTDGHKETCLQKFGSAADLGWAHF